MTTWIITTTQANHWVMIKSVLRKTPTTSTHTKLTNIMRCKCTMNMPGIAIGGGTDVAIESAGIILVRSNPLDVVKIFDLSRASYRKMVENLVWATGYNVVALPLAAGILYPVGILLSPAVGALFMSLSTVIVAINAQLLRRHSLAG